MTTFLAIAILVAVFVVGFYLGFITLCLLVAASDRRNK